LAATVGPHAAIEVELIEDHEIPGMRIYEVRSPGIGRRIGLTGEELEALAMVWADEEIRPFQFPDTYDP
jgi:hypothetical protein